MKTRDFKREGFAEIEIVPGKFFDTALLTQEMKKSLVAGTASSFS